MIAALEEILFRHRGFVLALLALFTLVSVGFCTRLELDTTVETHLPAEHEYMRTFLDYQEALLGTDRVLVVLRARQGDIWNVASLRKLKQVTDTLAALPGIDPTHLLRARCAARRHRVLRALPLPVHPHRPRRLHAAMGPPRHGVRRAPALRRCRPDRSALRDPEARAAIGVAASRGRP